MTTITEDHLIENAITQLNSLFDEHTEGAFILMSIDEKEFDAQVRKVLTTLVEKLKSHEIC